MRLPFDPVGDDSEPQLAFPGGLDVESLDWAAVHRSAYLIHQRISYRYEGPVRRLRQRLVVQPPGSAR